MSGGADRAVPRILLAVCLAPPLLAAAFLYLAPPGMLGDASHGTLLRATEPLPDVALSDPRGQAHGRLHGKWSLLYLGSRDCAARCRDALRRLRAAWLSLGSRAQRVQRVYVLPARAPPGAELQRLLRGHPGLWLWRLPTPGGSVRALFREGTLVLLDPRGLPVLRYSGDTPPADVAKDLKRLLRASRIG